MMETDPQVDGDDDTRSIDGFTSRSVRRRRARRSAKQAVVAEQQSLRGIPEVAAPKTLVVSQEMKLNLLQQIEKGGQATHSAVESILHDVVRMSMEPFGCRVVQAALDVASSAQKEQLVSKLHGHVQHLIGSPNGNFVIQKVVEVLPALSYAFVPEELRSFASETAMHRFGCRVLCRLVEHIPSSGVSGFTAMLIEELMLDVDMLVRHNFARHVMELILEHGTDAHRQLICDVLQQKALYYAKDRCSSYVVEKALETTGGHNPDSIAGKLLSEPEQFMELAMHECGMHVANAVMRLHGECGMQARALIAENKGRMATSKHGSKLLAMQLQLQQVSRTADRC